MPSLKTQIADLTAKAAKGGGVSSRELLDLREALNTKDKDLLELRDQLSSRDKQILELRDQNLQVARQKADSDDKVVELERSSATGARLDFVDSLPLGPFFQGVLEGAFELVGVRAQVSLILVSTGYALEISW